MQRRKRKAFGAALALPISSRAQQKTQDLRTAKPERKPNVVFILTDNTGWGDWSAYGGQVPTPRIDALAAEGIRFTNYCVESQCTPTRSAILTGRMPIRTGNNRVPFPGEGKMGLAPWEYTMAELLSDAGYNTALYGKWHIGNTPGRQPNDQGFDEWWGILNSSDEAAYSQYPLWRVLGLQTPQIWEGRKGSPSKPVAPFDMPVRGVRSVTDPAKPDAPRDLPWAHWLLRKCPYCGSELELLEILPFLPLRTIGLSKSVMTQCAVCHSCRHWFPKPTPPEPPALPKFPWLTAAFAAVHKLRRWKRASDRKRAA